MAAAPQPAWHELSPEQITKFDADGLLTLPQVHVLRTRWAGFGRTRS
jgi:hypothetical protein